MLSALKGSSAQMAIAISAVLNARCVKTMHHPVHSAIQEVIPCTVNQFSHHGATGVQINALLGNINNQLLLMNQAYSIVQENSVINVDLNVILVKLELITALVVTSIKIRQHNLSSTAKMEPAKCLALGFTLEIVSYTSASQDLLLN